ncbi:MAG TPA: DUF6519 domain-containing protein [Thermoanaerobaculia bacterium]
MSGDVSRDTFDRSKHYRAVYLQQGRLQLDADWNEQVDIQLYRLRTPAADLLGPTGALQDGFKIDVVSGKLTVRAGHLFASGLLGEIADTDLGSQPDGRYLVYLDLWGEQDVTAAQDPDLLEPALGGLDTTTRTRAVCQVKLQGPTAGAACGSFSPPAADPPGVVHHYVPLAVVEHGSSGWALVIACPPQILPVTETLDPNKVDRGGDSMTGPLTIQSNLFVTGHTQVGGDPALSASAGGSATPRLQVIEGALQPDAQAGILFASGVDVASLTFPPAGDGGKLVLAATGTTLTLRQGGADRLIVDTQGNVGIGTSTPLALLDAGGQTRATGLSVQGQLTLTQGAAAGSVLTSDAAGGATWQPLPTQAGDSPVFFTTPIPVDMGTSTSDWKTFTFSTKDHVPATASAVILEAEARENDKEFWIYIRRNSGSPALLLLRARALGTADDFAWGNQGIFPLDNGSFDYEVTGEVTSFSPFAWAIRAVGYFL